jgi:hypothetical protein
MASWADSRHGWVACPQDSRSVCSTDDGGHRWRPIFTGGNYLFAVVRTGSEAGVVDTGASVGSPFWTRDGGKDWYELPAIPTAGSEARGVVVAGRGNLLFWHQSATTLYQVTPWPPPTNPPCRGIAWPGPGTCVLADADSPFTSTDVATVPTGALMAMSSVEGGVVVLDQPDDPSAPPAAVLIHRNGANTLRPLPAPRGEPTASCAPPQLYATWPTLFVEVDFDFSTAANCARSRLVLWRSNDGGRTWAVGQTGQVSLIARTARRHALAVPIRIPAGTVRAFSSAPAGLALTQLVPRELLLPGGSACRITKLSVAWPSILATGQSVNGFGTARWWSNNGGATWAHFGRC